jgi:glycosyltransferase involved in cell wall biosynthesis
MVGPLPPERSGIAEYSAGLVEMLRDVGVRVDTVTQSDVLRDGLQATVDRVQEVDAVVYQMGNHPTYHGWMLPLMDQAPGVVHLHDLVLHHMVAGVLMDESRLGGDDYPLVLENWHSPTEIKAAAHALRYGGPIWGRDEVVDYPLHQVATKLATEVVVHSHYSAYRIAEAFPWLPITVLPQLYPVVAPHRVRDRIRTIAVMGGGQRNRRFDWIVQALAELNPDLSQPLVLEIAGEVEPVVQLELDKLAVLGNVVLVNHGRIGDDEFWAVFERADLMIALRQPTMGETSAVVSKALQGGLPTIVSDHGWYAELPACVKKIPPADDCPQALAALLCHMVLDQAAFEHWAEECADEAARPAFDPFAATEQYAKLLRRHKVQSDFRHAVADVVAGLKVDIDSPLSTELQRIDVRTTLRGDRWVEAALAGLGKQLLDSNARIVGQSASHYPYVEPLPEEAFLGRASVLEQDLGVVAPSSMISISVELINESEYKWFSPFGHSVRPFGIYLGHFWFPGGSAVALEEQPRTWIEGVVERTSSGLQVMTIRAPDAPGRYELEIDLVQESASWFKHRGFAPARLHVNVDAAQP